MPSDETVNVRYMVDDVAAAIDFYTGHFGFTVQTKALPAFADVTKGNLRLLLAGPASSAGRPMIDGEKPHPGGWNRIHFVVADLQSRSTASKAKAYPSAMRSSPAPAAPRSSPRIPLAT